ncbi:hypothetical protein [Streptomyces sp. TLI_105]|uniref:hypothetical protein n=1 Tax=Streptomyces sp. TLI_105 TaxID=1881019 RepID=UPI00089964F0|nr:hypothetical protein [Streptomyces sp. TLI_105]SEE26127.1 hypothetical protein SAMN05428939_7918 [Streptomyces sp. TLI_105]
MAADNPNDTNTPPSPAQEPPRPNQHPPAARLVDPVITAAHIGARASHKSALIGLGGALSAAVIAGIFLVATSDDDDKKEDAKPSATVTSHAAKPTASAPSPPARSTSADAESPEPSIDPAKPFPGEPLPLRLNGDSTCDYASHIDFDSYPFVTRVDRAEPDAEDAAAPADLNWYACSPVEFGTARDSHAGVLSKRQRFSKEACEAAANAGGIERILMHSNAVEEAGIIAGNSICVITDKGRLVRAQIVEAPWAPNLSLKITTVS